MKPSGWRWRRRGAVQSPSQDRGKKQRVSGHLARIRELEVFLHNYTEKQQQQQVLKCIEDRPPVRTLKQESLHGNADFVQGHVSDLFLWLSVFVLRTRLCHPERTPETPRLSSDCSLRCVRETVLLDFLLPSFIVSAHVCLFNWTLPLCGIRWTSPDVCKWWGVRKRSRRRNNMIPQFSSNRKCAVC